MMTSPEECKNKSKLPTLINKDSTLEKPNLTGEWSNLFLLLLLYIMQGLPLGLSDAIPVLLQSNKNVTYKDQALFSLVKWPYTLKLLWAPLVDSFYVHRIGRRKSWLIPVQFLMGMCFIFMANNYDDWFPKTGFPNIVKLLSICFSAKMLAATQDIVVDGWALTMLKKNNVGYSSTCGSTGTIIGVMSGSVLPVLLTSEEFCNKYFRALPGNGGLITMRSVLNVWGVLFVLLTTLIAVFKREEDCRTDDGHVKLSIFKNYLLLWDILKLRSIRTLAIVLLTARIGFAATEFVTILKLVDAGITKDEIMIMQTALFVIKVFLPIIVAKYTSGPKAMTIYLNVIPIRLLWGFAILLIVFYTPMLRSIENISFYYYAILGFIIFVDGILISIMSTALTGFFSRISDPRFGGTYMTLLNTLANFGPSWLSSLSLGMVDLLTFKKCSFDDDNNCSTQDLKNLCMSSGGQCHVTVNGYYIEMVLCTAIGFVWYFMFRRIIENLQTTSPSNWLVKIQQSTNENNKNSFSMAVT